MTDSDTQAMQDLTNLLDLAPRAKDLATRLVAAGPKAAHVSASETHEIADFVNASIMLHRAILAIVPSTATVQNSSGFGRLLDAAHAAVELMDGVPDDPAMHLASVELSNAAAAVTTPETSQEAAPVTAQTQQTTSLMEARDEFPILYESLDFLDERAAEQPERIATRRHISSLRHSIQAVVQKLSQSRARVADLESAAQALQNEPEVTGHDRLLRAAATQEAKDGIGAMDALHDLAIKHGACRTAAAGFAHVANGAFAALEGQVRDEIRRRVAAEKAAQNPPRAEPPSNETLKAPAGWREVFQRRALVSLAEAHVTGIDVREQAVRIMAVLDCVIAEAAPARILDNALTLNGYQLRAALEFLAPDGEADQLEQSVCIHKGSARCSAEEKEPGGHFCWLEEYPEEGSIRLDEEPKSDSHPVRAPAAVGNAKAREQQRAIKQGESKDSEFAYFDARSEIDTKSNRKLFRDGFDRGYDAAISAGGER